MLCYGCKQDKEPAEFVPDRSKPLRGGLSGYCKACMMWNNRVRRRGGTIRQGRDLLAASDGACAVCGKQADQLELDHDHSLGTLRELVCSRCNKALAYMEMFDNQPDYADSLRRYLTHHRQQAG